MYGQYGLDGQNKEIKGKYDQIRLSKAKCGSI